MKVEKKVISNLSKCYSLSELTYKGEHCFLVAAEKHDPCYLFAEDGTKLETVWEEPGGVMTMTPVPGGDGQFLATHRFYSPNDALGAKIIIATPKDAGGWDIRTLCTMPFIHRFGILNRAGHNYLIACCIKTGHEYKDDWRFPGVCFGAELPADLSSFGNGTELELTTIKTDMVQNHGFCKIRRGGHDAALVGCESGTYIIDPPAVKGAEWEVTQISTVPSSDSVLIDFNGNGRLELGVISPFHGAAVTIFRLDDYGNYVPQWKLPIPEADTEMLHATWACELLGKPTWIVGWRRGTRDLIAISWDEAAGTYKYDYIDRDTSCANCLHFVNKDGRDVIVAANHGSNEVAMYTITE